MNKSVMGVAALMGVFATVGCVSVESLRQQVNSSNKEDVAAAEMRIMTIVENRNNFIKPEEYIALLKNNDLRLQLVVDSRYRAGNNIQNAALEGVLFKNEEDAIGFVRRNKNAERGDVALQMFEKALDKISSDEGLQGIYSLMADQKDEFYYRIGKKLARVTNNNEILYEIVNDSWYSKEDQDVALSRISDEKVLLKILATHSDSVIEKISDEKKLADIARNLEKDDWQSPISQAGVKIVRKIKDPALLVDLALFAKNVSVATKAKDKASIRDFEKGILNGLKDGRISEERAAVFISWMKDEECSVAMYDAITTQSTKKEIFVKLKPSDRAIIRMRNKNAYEKMIVEAKNKGKDTFELGGFYLGMNISDVDELVGYYCPEWLNSEDYVDDDKTIRGLWVPQQKGAFCRAGKDGRVFELNFGKNFLKNFYKFDVQNEREWAAAYSRKEGVDLRYVHLSEDVKVVDYNDPGVPYHALYSQDTYTYKDNAKDYRITYFGEQKIAAGNGIVKQAARGQMLYVGGQQGMLRVRVEKD